MISNQREIFSSKDKTMGQRFNCQNFIQFSISKQPKCNLNNKWKRQQWHLMCSVIILFLCILVKHTSEAKKTTSPLNRYLKSDEIFLSDVTVDHPSSKFLF